MIRALTALISIAILFLMVSSATAVPCSMSKIENFNTLTSRIEHMQHSFETIKPSSMSNIIGIFYIIIGLISLYFTFLILGLALVAIAFNPMGFVYFLFALFPATLTVIFLSGGLSLLLSNNLLSNLETILSLSLVLFVTWILLRLNDISFIDIINAIIHLIKDFIPSLSLNTDFGKQHQLQRCSI